jgi:hypothetical protein
VPGGSVPTQVVDDDEAALADVGSMTSSKAPTPGGSTALQRRLADRSLAYMMTLTFRERADDTARRVERAAESPVTVTGEPILSVTECYP